jgi:hypothetical protein
MSVPADPLDASPGYFKTRLVKGGPFVPCRMWTVEDRDPETGELQDDVKYFAEVNGERVDPNMPPGWPWRVIDKSEFDYMIRHAEWCCQYSPDEPAANPRRPLSESEARMF